MGFHDGRLDESLEGRMNAPMKSAALVMDMNFMG